MAKYETDILQYLYETYNEQGFAYIDTTALNAIIQEYLETVDNGYYSEDYTYWDDDSTAYLTILVDSTSPTITVQQWKEAYLEQTYNQSFLQNGQISIRDHNSPNYPLKDFRTYLFDFDASSSIDYTVTPDTTGDIYIEYEYPTAEKVDGMYLQLGNNACQNYATWTNVALLNYYIGFSNDGQTWQYICNHEPVDSTSTTLAIVTTNKTTAELNCFSIAQDCPIANQTVDEVIFTDTAIEAKYWRLYIVDLYNTLVAFGEDAGYTGYTASLSHLRFQQIREHGETTFDKTLAKVKTAGVYSTSNVGTTSGQSGSGWFTNTIFTITSSGTKELSTATTIRIWADSTAEFRLQYSEDNISWTTVDSWEFLSEGNTLLIDSRVFTNPNANLSEFQFYYRLQDQAPVGTPNISMRSILITTHRSSETE